MPEIPPLPESTILLVEVGSTAHGTGLPGGEDHDEMGVVIEAPETILGLGERGFATVMQRTQLEGVRSQPGDTDRTLHSLRGFIRLAAGGNPSVLMALWAPVLHATHDGYELRALGHAFVGRHIIPRYRGYMQAQAMRLLGLRGGAREERIAEHGYDTKLAMHAARLGFQCIELLTTRQLNLPIEGEPADWLRAVRRGDVSFDDWWRRCLNLDSRLETIEADDSLPIEADRARIEAWSVATYLRTWSGRQ